MKSLRFSALYVLISALLVLSRSAFPYNIHIAPAQKQSAVPAIPESGAFTENHQTLFPSLDGSRITALHVRTADQTFKFRCDAQQSVSVNGNHADKEIFLTLISQILNLPVNAHEPFTPDCTPLMTLIISTHDGAQHTAHFYSESSSHLAQITSGSAGSLAYHQTDAWRIGTLMMACEGTRIQDAYGNEIPML